MEHGSADESSLALSVFHLTKRGPKKEWKVNCGSTSLAGHLLMHEAPECKGGGEGKGGRIKERRKTKDVSVETVRVWQDRQGPAPQTEKGLIVLISELFFLEGPLLPLTH